MAVERRDRPGRLAPGDVVRFTSLAALLAIFSDGALGHGLLWENDPYWTYWVTKTFLLATVIGLGTAWVGIGPGRGAAIIGVQTLVLTVYYWTLSPVGLPSSPEWLDLEHTWGTGIPVHFGVLYLGYLSALWLWRRRAARRHGQPVNSSAMGTRALIVGALAVILAGALSSAALADFPGVTWFLVRILLTVPLLMFWWSAAGRDATAAISAGVFLGLVWATYGHFLGPEGLPDSSLRILDGSPPATPVRWLDYRELWLIRLPIYVLVASAVLFADSRTTTGAGGMRRALSPAAALVLPLAMMAFTVPPEDRGQSATISAAGEVKLGSGPGALPQSGSGEIRIRATDMGARVTPLPPHDRLFIDATIRQGHQRYGIRVRRPMIEDPLGRHTTWWGVGFHVRHHGRSGIGTKALPSIDSELAAFGFGEVLVGGDLVASGVPVHVMTAESGLPGRLELDVGEEAFPVTAFAGGRLRAAWGSYTGGVSRGPAYARYAGGGAVLVLLLGAVLAMNRPGRPADEGGARGMRGIEALRRKRGPPQVTFAKVADHLYVFRSWSGALSARHRPGVNEERPVKHEETTRARELPFADRSDLHLSFACIRRGDMPLPLSRDRILRLFVVVGILFERQFIAEMRLLSRH